MTVWPNSQSPALLSDQPLPNPDLLLFVDGSASRDSGSGHCQAGYTVCDSHGVVESAPLPSNYSAQAAELVALTRACHLAANQSVTIYTDSKYAFGVVPKVRRFSNFESSACGGPLGSHSSALSGCCL